MTSDLERVRVDKWLWAARFFKTRSLATKAVTGGKVHLNGSRVKAAKEVKVGDELRIQKGIMQFVVTVLGLSARRGPAKSAALLYEEHPESVAKRQDIRDERRLFREAHMKSAHTGRPSKRDRRLIRAFTGKDM